MQQIKDWKWKATTGGGRSEKDLYNIDTHEEVPVPMCSFDGIRRGNYFGGEPTERAEVELRVGKFKKGKAAGKDEITGEMIKIEGTGWWIGSGDM